MTTRAPAVLKSQVFSTSSYAYLHKNTQIRNRGHNVPPLVLIGLNPAANCEIFYYDFYRGLRLIDHSLKQSNKENRWGYRHLQIKPYQQRDQNWHCRTIHCTNIDRIFGPVMGTETHFSNPRTD